MRPITAMIGPFAGMVDGPDQAATTPQSAAYLLNVYTQATAEGLAQLGRPGFVQMSSTQLGSAGARTAQCVASHTALDGTTYNFLVVGGKVYRVTFSKAGTGGAGTVTDVTPGGVSISTTSRVYACSLGDALIFSDGVNKPWVASSLSATPIIGTYIAAAAGAWYGPPVVYYARLFGIIAASADRDTIEWSAVNDATTGYGALNYQWQLGQQGGGEPLTCLYATNYALYYWRRSSLGQIAGTLEAEFQTTAQHDAVSITDGTLYPASVTATPSGILFADQQGRPRLLTPGGVVQDWPHAAVRATVDAYELISDAIGCHLPDLGLTGLAITSAGAVNEMLVFDLAGGTSQGLWRRGVLGATAQQFCAVGLLRGSEGQPYFSFIDQDGYWYAQKRESDSTSVSGGFDVNASNVVIATEHMVVSRPVVAPGADLFTEQHFDRVDVLVRSGALEIVPRVPLEVSYETPRASYGTAQTPTVPVAGVAGDAVKVTVGVNARGRWVRWKFRQSSALSNAPRFGFLLARATGRLVASVGTGK